MYVFIIIIINFIFQLWKYISSFDIENWSSFGVRLERGTSKTENSIFISFIQP